MSRVRINRNFVRDLKPDGTLREYADADLRGFYIRITAAGARSFVLRYRKPDGKFGRLKIGTYPELMPEDAREAARRELEQLDRFGDTVAATVERKKRREEAARIAGVPRLRDYVTGDYTDWCAVNRKSGDALPKLILSAFPADLLDRPMDAISVHALERWKIGAAAKGNAAATVARKISALQGAYSKAVAWRIVAENPIKHVERDASSEEIVRFLSPDERQRLYAALIAREEAQRDQRDRYNAHRRMRKYKPYPSLRNVAFTDYLRPAVLVSLNTGVRRGELLQLTWDDIDLEHAVLTVRRVTAKADKTRRIPLNREALDTLTKWKPLAHPVYVFAGETGEPITEIKSAWGNVLEAAEITNYRWHDHRHDFASQLVQRGADLNTVRELLGHADLKMVLRYAHLSKEHTAAAVALLDAPKKRVLRVASAKAV